MRKSLVLAFLVIFILAVSVSCGGQEQPAPASSPTTKAPSTAPVSGGVIELKIANFQSTTQMSNEMLTLWGKEIEKETGGKVKFTIYAGGVLVPANDTYDGVVNGIADIGFSMAGYSAGRFSLSEVVALPGLNLSGFGTLHSSKVLLDLWDMFPEIRAQYDDTHVLWVNGELYRQLISREPIKTVDDIKGKKLRVPGSESAYIQALGGVPVNLTGGEVYEALQRGVIDGNFHPWEAIVGYKLYEVGKHATMANINNGGVFIMTMNKNKYESLPADVREVIDAHSGRYGALDIQGTMREEYEKKFYDELVNVHQIPVYQFSDADRQKITEMEKPAVEKWIQDQEKRGLPGQKVYDECIKLVEKYR